MPEGKQMGILESIKLFFIQPMVFKLCEKRLLAKKESYREHGDKIFPDNYNEEETDLVVVKNNVVNYNQFIDSFTKKSIEKLHTKEVERRKESTKENNVPNILNSMTVKDVVLFVNEKYQHFPFEECVYIGQWEYYQIKFLVKKIDRTFQRFIPNQMLRVLEVASRVHDKLNELAKQIDLMEKSEKLKNSLKGNKAHEIDLFQFKMELEYYNHYYRFINQLHIKEEEEKNKDNPEVGSVKQHNLMIYYLLEYSKIMRPDVNATSYAKFVRSLTGMSRESIRKSWTDATFQQNNDGRKKDLKDIRAFFELIKAEGILKMIDNDLAMKRRTAKDNDEMEKN